MRVILVMSRTPLEVDWYFEGLEFKGGLIFQRSRTPLKADYFWKKRAAVFRSPECQALVTSKKSSFFSLFQRTITDNVCFYFFLDLELHFEADHCPELHFEADHCK
ncbi:hypothetical protein RclHR1_09800001 [Rhizophagus clarus]|uniref:Uncharacterized protein n=1 Tax=Rhizophagus clarus TaxID=94130 RepID=A0A2Z6SQS8_9GLOM|nr:hypothetical protein RclHR1_09800001 [Rhizophagus clarus]